MKKSITTVLSVLLVLLVLVMTSCSGLQSASPSKSSDSEQKTVNTDNTSDKSNPDSSSASSNAGFLPIANGDVELTIYTTIQPGASQVYTDYSEHPVVKKMMEETGLKLKFIHPTNDPSFFNVTIASGVWPDIWHAKFTSYPGGAEAAMEDGVLLNMNDLVEKYAPNFLKMISDFGVEREFVSDTGVYINYGATMIPDLLVDKVLWGFLIRNDLLKKYNLEMPYTYDELEKALDVFQTNGYSTPMAIPFKELGSETRSSLAAGFGVLHKGWFIKDGKALYSPIQDEYKEYLQLLNSWFKKGYFSTDSLGYSSNDTKEAMQAGKAVIGYGHAAHSTTVKSIGQQTDSGFDVVGMPVMRKNKEDTVSPVYKNQRVSSQAPWYISAKTPYPVEAMKFLDYLYLTDTQLLTAWGPGTKEYPTFSLVDGKRQFSDFMTKHPDGIDFQTAKDRYCLLPFQIMYDEEMEFQQYNYPEKLKSIEFFNYRTSDDGIFPGFASLTVEENREIDRIMSQIDTYTSEMIDKFIIGQEPIDRFEDFVAQVKALNIERAAQIKTDSYERYINR
jgi:putative aldouronate transport system substrate-binding protein